jgi:glutamine cyclotransferase
MSALSHHHFLSFTDTHFMGKHYIGSKRFITMSTKSRAGGGILKRSYLIFVFIAFLVLTLGVLAFNFLSNLPNYTQPNMPRNYTYRVLNAYPHDKNAFTEGLVFEDGVLYEGTGLNGESTLRRVELETGNVLQLHNLSDQFFGEGITIFEDRIIQLTWQSHKGFVYNESSFELLQEFSYPTEGWGITHDESRLIMSDGTATLHFLNPETFEEIGTVNVLDNGTPITRLNELEYINGEVYANVWLTEKIAIVNPQTGVVRAWIDMSGIRNWENLYAGDVLNGIAYDAAGDRLLITGKFWSLLFQIELIPSE